MIRFVWYKCDHFWLSNHDDSTILYEEMRRQKDWSGEKVLCNGRESNPGT
jgi:hypothetical protein